MNITDTATIKLKKKAAKIAKAADKDENDVFRDLMKEEKSKDDLKTIKINYEKGLGGLDVKDKEYLQGLEEVKLKEKKAIKAKVEEFHVLQKRPHKINIKVPVQNRKKRKVIVDYSSSSPDEDS